MKNILINFSLPESPTNYDNTSFGDHRTYYYVSTPQGAWVIVCRNGLTTAKIDRHVVSAKIGTTIGYAGFVPESQIGQQVGVITFFAIQEKARPDLFLASIFSEPPKYTKTVTIVTNISYYRGKRLPEYFSNLTWEFLAYQDPEETLTLYRVTGDEGAIEYLSMFAFIEIIP